MAVSITKGRNTLLLTIVKELDREDVYQLHSDLGKWLDDTIRYDSQNAGPSGLTFHNKEHYEAYLQSQSKLTLSKEIQKDIEERFGDKYYVTSDGKAIKREKYDIVPSEIELQQLKKQSNEKRK